jgi:hypothetical protein
MSRLCAFQKGVAYFLAYYGILRRHICCILFLRMSLRILYLFCVFRLYLCVFCILLLRILRTKKGVPVFVFCIILCIFFEYFLLIYLFLCIFCAFLHILLISSRIVQFFLRILRTSVYILHISLRILSPDCRNMLCSSSLMS